MSLLTLLRSENRLSWTVRRGTECLPLSSASALERVEGLDVGSQESVWWLVVRVPRLRRRSSRSSSVRAAFVRAWIASRKSTMPALLRASRSSGDSWSRRPSISCTLCGICVASSALDTDAALSIDSGGISTSCAQRDVRDRGQLLSENVLPSPLSGQSVLYQD